MYPSVPFPLNRDEETQWFYLFGNPFLVLERKPNSCMTVLLGILFFAIEYYLELSEDDRTSEVSVLVRCP